MVLAVLFRAVTALVVGLVMMSRVVVMVTMPACVVAGRMAVVVTSVVIVVVAVAWCEELVASVIIAHVCERPILNVASEQALLRERRRVLSGVDPPAQIAAEKQRTLLVDRGLLLKVVLEQLARLACFSH